MACGYTAVFVFAEIEVLMRTVADTRRETNVDTL